MKGKTPKTGIIGAVVSESKLGIKGRALRQYIACPDCGELRWARINQIRQGKTRCISCANRIHSQRVIQARLIHAVEHRDELVSLTGCRVVRASEIGRVGRNLLVEKPCIDCGKLLYIRYSYPNHRCNKCASVIRGRSYRGEKNYRWKGGRVLRRDGYIECVIYPEDTLAIMGRKGQGSRLRVFEHRLVIARHLGRPLEDWEIVHHKNGNRSDNRVENLELLPNSASNIAYAVLEQEIQKLNEQQQELLQLTRLLCWHLGHGNSVAKISLDSGGKALEAIHGASQVDEEMVQSQ